MKETSVFKPLDMAMLPMMEHTLVFENEFMLTDNFGLPQQMDEVSYFVSPLYPFKIDFTLMLFCTAGTMSLRINLQECHLGGGQVLVVLPGTVGECLEVNFDEAEMVNAGTPVISLLDVGGMEVELDVPATVYRRQADIERITCQTADTPAKSISMKLLSLTPKADATQLYRMRLGFSSTPDASLTAGRNVQVRLCLAETDSLRNFVLPLASLFQEQGESYVWTVGGDSIINRMKVSVQGTTPEGRAIVAGLRGDESVVRAGVHALREGEKVRIIDESSETNVGGQL